MKSRLRTIEQAYRHFKEADKETAVTRNSIRKLIINGTIPSLKSGSKYLIDLNALEDYFSIGEQVSRE